jgi:hypothetical protein
LIGKLFIADKEFLRKLLRKHRWLLGRKRYRTVSIPEELYATIDEIVKSGRGGYASVGEFIKEAARNKLRELGIKI